jgi:hypothetical protein
MNKATPNYLGAKGREAIQIAGKYAVNSCLVTGHTPPFSLFTGSLLDKDKTELLESNSYKYRYVLQSVTD